MINFFYIIYIKENARKYSKTLTVETNFYRK